jgi:hypothetical protein
MKPLYFLAFVSLLLVGCGGADTPANNAARNAGANTAAPPSNANNPLAAATATPSAVTNEAPTLTAVYQGFCDAYAKKDEAGIRKAWSAATLKQFEADMKADNIKTLVELLELDAPKGKCSVRNEVISGDTATAELVSGAYPNGMKVQFVKENGEWKMTTNLPK